MLLLLPQRYVFSSKSQHVLGYVCKQTGCYCYHKGTYFQANHNHFVEVRCGDVVVIATTKVRIFKQITTSFTSDKFINWLLLLPQRYVFSSKSQQPVTDGAANGVVIATTKVRIFKQITTNSDYISM